MATPTRMRITADIEWAGDYNRRAHRTTTLDGLDLSNIGPTVRRVGEARKNVGAARVLGSYRAVGWHAQLRELVSTKAGQAAAARAGLAPTKRTLVAWLARDREPQPRNVEKIHGAYDAMRRRYVLDAQESLERANHALTERLNRAVTKRYGVPVRFFDITAMKFLP